MTEDDTKVIAHIRRKGGLKSVAKVSTFVSGNVTFKIYDHGMEAGDYRYYVEVTRGETYSQSTEAYRARRLEDALGFVDWGEL